MLGCASKTQRSKRTGISTFSAYASTGNLIANVTEDRITRNFITEDHACVCEAAPFKIKVVFLAYR